MSLRLLPLLALTALVAAPAADAQIGLRTKLIAEGFDAPTGARWAEGYPNMMVVPEKSGLIKLVRDGETLGVPLIDLTAKVKVSGLGGLQNVEFHPRYFINGWFYVHYMNADNNAVVERYTVPNPGTFQADPDSALTIIGPLVEPIVIHGGGGMAFDAFNRLYVGFGDRRVELPGQSCQSQDPTTLVGKLVRVNDDGSIPPSNPFVGDPNVRDEIFAFGLRQAYRVTVDPQTQGVLIADVGEGSREEINYIPPGTSSQNFGWQVLEGEICTPSIACSSFGCPNPALDAPIFQYSHNEGCAVIGGYRYRGGNIPGLFGAYVATDWCTGTTWAFGINPTGAAVALTQIQNELAPFGGLALEAVNSWGQDLDEELYIVDQGFGFTPIGEIYAVLPREQFEVNRDVLSLATGGTAEFRVDVGPEHADEVYLVLGSLTGTTPVTPFGGFEIPLALDTYFLQTLSNPNSGAMPFSFGNLDANGRAVVPFILPAGLPPTLASTELFHAAVSIDVTGSVTVTEVTNAERLRLLP